MSNYGQFLELKFYSFEILRYLESNLILYIFENLKYLALPCNKKKFFSLITILRITNLSEYISCDK